MLIAPVVIGDRARTGRVQSLRTRPARGQCGLWSAGPDPVRARARALEGDERDTGEVLLLVALMALNGFLAMARTALINVRKMRLRQLVDEGVGSARTAERLAEDASRLLATTQLGKILTSFFSVRWWRLYQRRPGQAIGAVVGRGQLRYCLCGSVFVAGCCDARPGRTGPRNHRSTTQRAAGPGPWPAHWLSYPSIAMPMVHVMVWLSKRRLPASLARNVGAFCLCDRGGDQDLVDAGEEEGVIEQDEKAMIYSIFELGDTLVREVMVPRIDVVAVEANCDHAGGAGSHHGGWPFPHPSLRRHHRQRTGRAVRQGSAALPARGRTDVAGQSR